jgi:hypothetical protein
MKMKKLLLMTMMVLLIAGGFVGTASAASTSKQFTSCNDLYGCLPAYLITSEDSLNVYASVELQNGGMAPASNSGWYKFELQRYENYVWTTISTKYDYAQVAFDDVENANVTFSNISNVKNVDHRIKLSEYENSGYTGLRQVVYSYYWNR